MRGLLLLPFLALPAHAQFWARLGNPDVKVTATHAPDLGLLLGSVAVAPVAPQAAEAADAVRAELAGDGAKLMDPATVTWACAGENLSAPDGDMLVRLQRRLGDVRLILVTVSRADIQQTRSTHPGKENGKSVTYQVADTAIAFEGQLRVADLASGRLYAPAAFHASPHASAESAEAPPAFPDAAPLRAQAVAEARAVAAHMLLPWTETFTEICFNDRVYDMDKVYARIKANDLQGARDQALQSARAARADGGGELKYRARAIYDLGLVALMQGQTEEAQLRFREALNLLPDASIFQDAMRDAAKVQAAAEGLARWRNRGAAVEPAPDPGPAPSGDSPEARLKSLKRLHDQGLITDKDYEAKKAEILKGL